MSEREQDFANAVFCAFLAAVAAGSAVIVACFGSWFAAAVMVLCAGFLAAHAYVQIDDLKRSAR